MSSGISKHKVSKYNKQIPFNYRNNTHSNINTIESLDNYPFVSENECLFKVDEQQEAIQSKPATTKLNYSISSTIDSIPVQPIQAKVNQDEKIKNINIEGSSNTKQMQNKSSSVYNESNRIAEFLAKQIHKFHGCSVQQHIQLSDDATNTDQQFEYKTVPPCSICPEDFGVNIPSVMDKDTFLQSSQIQLTTSDLNRVYCGLTGENGNIPVRVSFAIEDVESLSFKIHQNTTFDIDSVMALPQSLAVAKHGLKVYFYPPRFMNIQKDLHIRFSVLNPKTNRNNTVTIQKIPHFLIGQFFGFGELKLFLFLPKLYCPNKQTNFLTDSDMERFYNRLLLPAIYSTCPSDIIQRIPASLAKAKQNSFARGTESKNKKTNTFGFSQMIGFLLAPCYLSDIWRYMQIHSSDDGLQDFGDMFLFLDGKDFKTITRYNNPERCFRSFFDLWRITCDERHLDPNTTWLDYGKEVVNDCSVISPYVSGQNYELRGSPKAPLTYLWRKCCLETYSKQMATEDQSGTRNNVFYPWALFNDVCNMTITPNRNSVFRKAGLVYSQFYTITHEIFKAGKTYPFENDGLEGLAVDPTLAASWLNVGGGSKWSMDTSVLFSIAKRFGGKQLKIMRMRIWISVYWDMWE
ncbi:hypothetical protein DFP73DRAFT_601927 [Morchella snyderi]|nr:hypothetical protein DFP73DRAFT_601927 [Morchella snyderi]